MKKLIFALCVCAGLCACSSDDDLLSSTSSEDLGQATAFLTVNLKDVNSSTRATDGGFAYGTENEQKVNNAYFYFYDDNGNYMAKGNVGTTSGTASTHDGTGVILDGNIEWESATVVAIYGLDEQYKSSFPTQMLTVVNKPSDIDLTNKTLAQATAILAGTPYGSEGDFVMSTSTYYNSATSPYIFNTTALTADDFHTEPTTPSTDYPNGGVDVYVERLAAKVTATDGINYNSNTVTVDGDDGTSYSAVNITANIPHIASSDIAGIAVRLVGWDVNGTARDAYLSKQIGQWTSGQEWEGWDDNSNFRCYWAESPNYGVSHYYPTSSLGNTDSDEASEATWLDEYLKYTSLYSPNAFDSGYAYCGENTNTAEVLVGDTCHGITNLLVKAQALTEDNSNIWHGSDLVEYHGSLYTAADFCQTTVDDVVDYDFTVVVDEVIEALKDEYGQSTTVSQYIEQLKDAIILDHIYKTAATGTNHRFGTGYDTAPTTSTEITPFGGEMLSLYNIGDGNVDIFYNGAQPYWGTGSETDPFTAVGSDIIAKYPASDIVYGGADLDKYDFWFHVDYTKFGQLIGGILSGIGVMYQIGGTTDSDWYMPIDNSISFTTEAMGDDNFSGGHVYTTRNFLLRTITVEADGIDSEFGSHYPNLYKNGYMYYSVPIEHLATSSDGSLVEGEYGIVRNHWYNITVNSISGLGRGIAKDEEVIIPQPDITYYYLGADINILSWHHVTQSVGW